MKSFSINNLLQHWYGDPLSPEAARERAQLATAYISRHGQQGSFPFIGMMLQMIAEWWLDESRQVFPLHAIHYANSRRKMALYHLITGQLMMCCKLEPAMDYLDMGLRHADGLIGSEQYFALYNRHEELRFLKLSPARQKPHSLAELLNESRVMRKLAPYSRYSIPRST